MSMLGWVANALIVLSWWLIAGKHRHALLPGIAGSALWSVVAWDAGMMDLLTIEVVLTALGIRAWWRWGDG